MRIAITLALLCLLVLQQHVAICQTRLITGTVKDPKSGPVPFATVHQKGTSRSASTDEKGNFRIEVAGNNPVLEISSSGFSTQEINLTSGNSYNVVLQQGGNLSEVVVTALGITRKERSIGYSTQQISGENLTVAKEQNVLGSLAGKISGVQLSGSSAASMGGTQKIQLRGVNSITGEGEPLIIVDGTPISNSNYAVKNGRDYGDIAQDINPDDVESINVLKGPAAAALYGLRGQYGAIMITTKKGSKNKKPTVNFSSSFTLDKAGNYMPLQDIYGAGSSLNFPTININGVSTKYVDGTWDESWGPKMDGTPVRHQYSFYPADPDFGKATPFVPQPDNIKQYFETGHTINNSISFAGGGENTSFRLSYNNTTIKGIEPNTWLRRNNLGLNGSINVLSNLSISANINYANNSAQRPSQGYQALGSRNMYQWFERNLDMNRLKQYKYSDGTFYQWNVNDPNDDGIYEDMIPIDWNNPYFDAYENPAHDSRDRLFGNIGATYTIIPGLQVSGFIRQDNYTQNIDKRNAEGGRGTPSFSIGKYENKENNYEFLAQYNKEFGKFSVAAALGGNILKQNYSYLYQQTVGGLVTPGFYNISNSLERPNVENYLRKKEVRSAYGSVTLGYNNTYFLDASLRRDISSTLPSENNAYVYPSVSASVVFSELLKWQPLSYGKARLSFAQAGADLQPYKTTSFYNLGSPYNGNFPEYVPDSLSNGSLEPSLSTAYEAGLDLRFFKDRLGISATYYHQENKKAILDLDISGASGYQTYVINAGNIQNKGLELSLNAIPVKTKNTNWSTTINYAYNKNKILELYPGLNSLLLDQNTYARVSMYLLANVGEPFGTIIGNGYKRDPKTGKILLGTNNMPLYETGHNLGTAVPKFTGGWTNTVTWKNFDFAANIDFQSGGKFISWTRMLAVKSGQAAETAAMNDKGKNIRDPLADGGGFKIEGISAASGQDVTAYVSARTYYRNTIGTQVYEEWVYDASYIRMRELRLGYTFAKANYAKLPFRSINIAFIARNPFMIWQKAPKGVNPAELATGASSLNWLETGQLATVRSYGLNLNVNF
ncbi:SusC/RagA family TonB-linked outer membrane protein [Pinibacter soli]|uniref:SusC/RagA family TonB-linked outer membrane protein n=1 Tax=Pinibacter soli TaxID=3044211 RepID=A0ABT6RIU5_9BACT|nr:SusC/RagA family TonB-linked outer membrane protein [Pinibacter soli]MDI3322497.1 SusC/RagA family TonB-linked outer membrane protein [Pinibacter soli]